MSDVQYAKTANRSVVGILNEFTRQTELWLAAYGHEKGDDDDLLAISVKLSPLYKRPVSPDRALQQLVTASDRDPEPTRAILPARLATS